MIRPALNSVQLSPLIAGLWWMVRLRWLAGGAIIAAAVGASFLLPWSSAHTTAVLIGIAVLGCNIASHAVVRRCSHPTDPPSARRLVVSGWLQISLDLLSLTVLVLVTGGINSPLLGLFVLHMVFAGLLLPPREVGPFLAALFAISSLLIGLAVTGQWPLDRNAILSGWGWMTMLLLTVYVANHIAASLHRQQQKLASLNETLVKHRETMLQQERLTSMGSMAAGIAHEIANPLSNMDSMLQLAARHPERDKPELIGRLREQIARVNEVVREMTSFAHPTDFGWRTESVNDLVRSSHDMVRFDHRSRRVKATLELEDRLSDICMMPHAMQLVLVNIMMNAVDALDETDDPQLTVSTVHDGESHIVIKLADNGSGIEAGHLDHVFDPFFTTKAVGSGTGLGLSIAHAIIERHGGQIAVQSAPKEGTTFAIRLPCCRPASEARDGTASSSSQS